VPPSISTHEKGLGSGREHEEHPLYRAEEGEEKPESPTIQPTGGLRHQTSAGVLSHQASGILHHQTSGMMHHQTSGMLHPGASGILHHQTSSIYASERSKASTSWQNPKAALSSAMRFFGLTSGINSASALDLAAEVFELALTICMATAPEIMSFVEAFSGEEKKALQRLCSTAKKVGLLGASSPKWNTPAPLSELARAFLTQENSASRGRSGSKDINPMTMNELRSASSLSLSSAVAAKGGKDMKDVKRQVTFDMEEQDKSSSGSGKTSLKRGGTGSRSNLGLDRSRSDLGRVLNLNRSASDLSCSSFTDFNKRNKGFNIASPEKMRPSFLDFLTSLEQRPHGTGHAGMGMGMGMGIGMDVQETGVQMVMDIAIPGVGGRAPLDTVSEAGMSYHSHFDAVFGSEGEEKETVQAEVLNVAGGNTGSPGHMRIAFRSKCLRTQNEWQRQLLTQQRCLLNMVSTKLKAAEQTVKVADELGSEQKELLRGFRKIIVREVAEDEGQHRVSVYVIEKNDIIRNEVEELCRILEYPCQAFMSLGAARSAIRDDALEVGIPTAPSDKSLTSLTPSGRFSSGGSLLEGRSSWETADWRSRALTPSSVSSAKHGKGNTSKGFFLNDTAQSVRLVLLGVAWVDKDLPPEWQQEGIYVVLTSQAEEFEDVGRALFASGEAEIRDKLRARNIHEYLLHPLSLEGMRSSVGEAFRRRFSDEYLLLQAVGRGTSGVVHRAKRLPDGGTYALKEINTKRLSRSAKAEVEREGLLLKELRWPTVVFLVDTWENTGDRLRYLLMPLLDGGNLLQRTEASNKDSLQKASGERIAEWYAQTLHGLTYLHWRGVIHRDLKPGNLLLGSDDRSLQIGDLGSASLLPGPGPHPARKNAVKGAVCTPLYAAPETLLSEMFTTGTDVWSVGATFYEVLTLTSFFPPSLDIPKLQEAARQFDFMGGPWPAALSELKSSLSPILELPDMMQPDHLLRPTASELVGRPTTFTRLRRVLGSVGAFAQGDDRRQHFDEFEKVRSESDAAANLDPPKDEDRGQPEQQRQPRQRRHQH